MIRRRNDSGGLRERPGDASRYHSLVGKDPLIVVAVPPTGPAEHLVDLASTMAASTEGRLLLATVVSLPRITPYFAVDSLLAARSRRLGRIERNSVGRISTTRVVVVAHGVGSALVNLAEQRDADLVIAGWPSSPTGSGPWPSSEASVHELVTHAPCSVCVVERLPASPPELVIVSAESGREAELGMLVARAMISCAHRRPSPARLPRRLRPRERSAGGARSSQDTVPTSGFTFERVAVTDPVPITGDGSAAERATALGADVLVAGALDERGVWPVRRRILRTDLANSFSGPVALVHPARWIDGEEQRTDGEP